MASIFILIETDTKNRAGCVRKSSSLVGLVRLRNVGRQGKYVVPNLRRVEYLGRIPVFFLIPFDFVVSTHRQDCDFAFEMLVHDFTPPLKPTLQKIPFPLWIQPCTLGPDAFAYVHNVPGPEQYSRLGVIFRD